MSHIFSQQIKVWIVHWSNFLVSQSYNTCRQGNQSKRSQKWTFHHFVIRESRFKSCSGSFVRRQTKKNYQWDSYLWFCLLICCELASLLDSSSRLFLSHFPPLLSSVKTTKKQPERIRTLFLWNFFIHCVAAIPLKKYNLQSHSIKISFTYLVTSVKQVTHDSSGIRDHL